MKGKDIAIVAVLFAVLVAVPMVLAEDLNTGTDTNTVADQNAAITTDTNSVLDANTVVTSTTDINATIDSDTQQEIHAMTTGLGAQVRLLQLEKSLTRNVLMGQVVLDVLQTNHPDTNTSAAQATLNEMESTVGNVKALEAGTDLNTVVQQFVVLKKEGISLTQDFRKETGPYLDANDRQQISDRVKSIDANELKPINDEIGQLRDQFNANKIEALLRLLDTNNPDLIASISAGTATQAQINTALKDAYNNLSAGQKAAVNALLKENIIKRVVAEKAITTNVKENLANKLRQRFDNRVQNLKNWVQQHIDQNNGFSARAKRIVETDLNQLRSRVNQTLNRNWRGGMGNNNQGGNQ